MGNNSENNYISQAEASELAGVSGATLLRFAEAGYFRTYEQNGHTHFSKVEICQVFGPAISASPPSKSVTPEVDSQELKNNSALSRQIEKIIEPSDEYLTSPGAENKDQQGHIQPSEPIVIESISAAQQESSSKTHIEAFKKVLQLQEELLNQNKIRIEELIKERDWLRSRLEKMEDKSDRDQMLLMVESQKVRTLIDKASPKPGILRLALGWLGGTQSEQDGNSKTGAGLGNK